MQENVLVLRRYMLRNLRGQGHNACNLLSNVQWLRKEKRGDTHIHTYVHTHIYIHIKGMYMYTHIYKGYTHMYVCV